jgi:DNA helicase HerA-like ATPase
MMKIDFAKTSQGQTLSIPAKLANRHGLIAGATGTGKTISLQVLAERFSQMGVPVFLADVKGDLSGLAQAGVSSPKLLERCQKLQLSEPAFSANPVLFWDVFGKSGHPARTTLSEMGPTLLSRLMNLNETQTAVLQVAFKIADDSDLLLLDVKDLQALLKVIQENLDAFKDRYGHLSSATLGAIQRGLLGFETQGVAEFFSEPALNINDLMQVNGEGRGMVSILAAEELLRQPMVYSTFLLWVLSELFETLPEVGDQEKPKLVLFIDEAHLLFKEAPTVLVDKVEQVVRLIRSKGVGVYFVTQSPSDIPETVLGQLSHRIQHALRAFTPQDQRAVKVAAQTLRPNPDFSAQEVITQLGVGEALVSVLNEEGVPSVVERAFILPPGSQIGPISPEKRKALIQSSPVFGRYENKIDRESAFEKLQKPEPATTQENRPSAISEILLGTTGPRGGRKAGLLEKAATSAVRSAANNLGRELARGLLGSLLGPSRSKKRK